MDKEINSPILSAEIFTVLKNRIIHWEYLPDHRLIEISLCNEFGVSRSPIREVLQMLEEKGLVVKVPRIGYTVRQLNLQDIYELYDYRLAMELFIVEQLAQIGMDKITLNELENTWNNYLNYNELIGEEVSLQDELFHESLAKSLGNSYLFSKIKEVNERLHFIRLNDITTLERLHTTSQQHLNIIEKISKHDVEGARDAMRMNILEGRLNVDQAIKEALSQAYIKARAVNKSS